MKVTVIRTNGTREQHEIKARGSSARIRACYALAGCEAFDTVNLRDGRVMLVDDDGWECECIDHGGGHLDMKLIRARKPINNEATKIYWQVCGVGTMHQIVGDVIIAWDRDFA